MSNDVMFVVKLRDAAQIIADAANEYLEKQAPEDEEKPSWDPSKIKWDEAEGPKGKFERSEDINNLDFKALVKDLAHHKGKLTRDNLFYWLFENGVTVGRKKRSH